MNETGIEKKRSFPIREKAQYAMAFGVIALMLFAAGFPLFLLFFVGVLTFFVWKVFSAEGRSETRRVFEFYLTANEILRDDDRRWYGFEIQEAISRGEAVLTSMTFAPPLVHFGVGALYQKLDDHSSAAKHLAQAVDSPTDETSVVFPNRELREYVRMLRKIERAPAETPQTSAAIRSLERARKNRGATLLENSRKRLDSNPLPLPQAEQRLESVVDIAQYRESDEKHAADSPQLQEVSRSFVTPKRKPRKALDQTGNRQTISEVLHDIYDKNA